ncbi:hypothetical protein OPV22_018224 [Ensete ventricosum]|uniref:Uncharacterized protein n=1 Tax=Ensete ventricosum TaxID=4639 RepID=A0AAV8QQ40_ENSVE|nr:hypothetical protein OPV22_018224 [Ensete ventricosum]
MCGSTHHYHLMLLMFERLNLSLDDAVLVEVGWNTFSSSKNSAKCIWWVKSINTREDWWCSVWYFAQMPVYQKLRV